MRKERNGKSYSWISLKYLGKGGIAAIREEHGNSPFSRGVVRRAISSMAEDGHNVDAIMQWYRETFLSTQKREYTKTKTIGAGESAILKVRKSKAGHGFVKFYVGVDASQVYVSGTSAGWNVSVVNDDAVVPGQHRPAEARDQAAAE